MFISRSGEMLYMIRFCIFLFSTLFLFLNPNARCEEARTTTLYAVGDVMLGRYIAKVMSTRGSDYPFKEIAPTLKQGDIVFGNLESIISDDNIAPSFPEKPYSFHAPQDAAQVLKNAGFTILGMANNHAMDYGSDSLAKTRRLLGENGIAAFGAGKNMDEARQPEILIKNGLRFGFLGYGVAHSRSVYAKRNRPGIAAINMEDIHKDIKSLRSKVDVLVVSLHWGMEYDQTPSHRQQEEAHEIIDWGADLILGHHPHVMQGIEVFKGKVIAYSLGNFIFDQKDDGTNRSFILACTFQRTGPYPAEVIPLDRFRSYFPKVATNKNKDDIVERLRAISLPLNSSPDGLIKLGLIHNRSTK